MHAGEVTGALAAEEGDVCSAYQSREWMEMVHNGDDDGDDGWWVVLVAQGECF